MLFVIEFSAPLTTAPEPVLPFGPLGMGPVSGGSSVVRIGIAKPRVLNASSMAAARSRAEQLCLRLSRTSGRRYTVRSVREAVWE